MANLKDVIYLSNEDYETLVTTGTVVIGGVTLTYDENNLYITPDATYHLASGETGTVKYLEDISYTSASASGTDTFVKTLNVGSGSFTPTTKYLKSTYTPGNAITEVTKKYLHFTTGSTPSRQQFDYATGGFDTSAAMNFNTGSSSDNKYLYEVSGGSAVVPTDKYLHFSTSDVSPNTHVHSYTPAGSVTLTGTYSDTSGTRRNLSLGATFTGTQGNVAATGSSATKAYTSRSVNTTAEGGTPFVESVSGGSAVSPTYRYAKFTAPVLSTSSAYSITGVGSVPSLSVNTSKATGDLDFIESGTSGSVGGSVGLVNTGTSGDGIEFLESATHTHTATTINTTASAVTGVTPGSITKTTKYLSLEEDNN